MFLLCLNPDATFMLKILNDTYFLQFDEAVFFLFYLGQIKILEVNKSLHFGFMEEE